MVVWLSVTCVSDVGSVRCNDNCCMVSLLSYTNAVGKYMKSLCVYGVYGKWYMVYMLYEWYIWSCQCLYYFRYIVYNVYMLYYTRVYII